MTTLERVDFMTLMAALLGASLVAVALSALNENVYMASISGVAFLIGSIAYVRAYSDLSREIEDLMEGRDE